MQNKLTSDYDDGGIKVWCNGKLIMHANHEQAKDLVRYLCSEWNITPPNKACSGRLLLRRFWVRMCEHRDNFIMRWNGEIRRR